MYDSDPTTFGIFQKTGNPNYFAGRIGIGTLPGSVYQLHMKSAAGSNSYFWLDTSDTGIASQISIGFLAAGAKKYDFGTSGLDNSLYLAPNGLSGMRIYQNGNIGILPDLFVGINSALHVSTYAYAQFENQNAGAPPAADCDAIAERGRWSLDTANDRLYVCAGTSTARWSYTNAI